MLQMTVSMRTMSAYILLYLASQVQQLRRTEERQATEAQDARHVEISVSKRRTEPGNLGLVAPRRRTERV